MNKIVKIVLTSVLAVIVGSALFVSGLREFSLWNARSKCVENGGFESFIATDLTVYCIGSFNGTIVSVPLKKLDSYKK